MSENSVWYKKWWGIAVISFGMLFLIFLIAFSFYVYDIIKKTKKEGLPAKIASGANYNEKDFKISLGNNNNYWLGAADAKIVIVEFGDFACPVCKNSYPKIREIGIKYKNNVKIIFRDYPLKENSPDLTMAGRCAGEQGLFWPMHDKLFQNQRVYQKNNLTELANQIGADTKRFSDCLESEKYLTQIRKDFSDGELLKITGTPTWFVNGYKIEGDAPMKVWEEIINKFLIPKL